MIDASLLEEALGESALHTEFRALSGGNSGVPVACISGTTASNNLFSVVAKSRTSSQPHAALWYDDDPGGLDREYWVYELLEHLELPHASILARNYVNPAEWTLVLEDLSQNYNLPSSEYSFTEGDRHSIIDTYARIHAATLNKCQKLTCLQPEEGSQVDERTAPEMFETLRDLELDGAGLEEDEFDCALSILLQCRTRWEHEPRCLVFNDFHQTNVALPRNGSKNAVLFDWELAGMALPQFDALNAGFADESGLALYAERIAAHDGKIDLVRFKAGLGYAELSRVFYTLWLLHQKLRKDRTGSLPKWMRNLTAELFRGGLAERASAAIKSW